MSETGRKRDVELQIQVKIQDWITNTVYDEIHKILQQIYNNIIKFIKIAQEKSKVKLSQKSLQQYQQYSRTAA